MDQNPQPIPIQTPTNKTDMLLIQTPDDDVEIETQLNEFDLKVNVIKAEKMALRLISILLLVHGINSIYHELIEIFYVFPHLPLLFEEIGYAPSAFKSLYQKSVLVTATAAIETIYSLAVISRMKHLAHRLHIFSGICLFIISFLIASQNQKLETMDSHHLLPKAPTIKNIINADTFSERVDLFRIKSVEDDHTS